MKALRAGAGSERVGKSEATGDRLEEAKHINKSLSALGQLAPVLMPPKQDAGSTLCVHGGSVHRASHMSLPVIAAQLHTRQHLMQQSARWVAALIHNCPKNGQTLCCLSLLCSILEHH